MFKKIIISTVLFFLFPISALAEPTSVDPLEILKQNVSAFITKNNISAATVQIYNNGKPQSLYFGEAKPATPFDVGSLVEIMTGLLLAQQVDAAKVQLSTPVMQFFSVKESSRGSAAGSSDFSKITLRSLATNTSGLPANATINYVTDAQLNVVDESWQPSSVGMTMLTKALETIAHKNITELYQRQIFSVLGMRPVKSSSNDLKISAADMQKFLAAAIGLPGTPESILYPMRLTQTAFVTLNNRMIGLGWQINAAHQEITSEKDETQVNDDSVKEVPARPVFKADRQYDKAASRAYIAVLPDKKTGVVILLSAQVNERELAQLGNEILARLQH